MIFGSGKWDFGPSDFRISVIIGVTLVVIGLAIIGLISLVG